MSLSLSHLLARPKLCHCPDLDVLRLFDDGGSVDQPRCGLLTRSIHRNECLDSDSIVIRLVMVMRVWIWVLGAVAIGRDVAGHGAIVSPRSRNSVDFMADPPVTSSDRTGQICQNITGGPCQNGQVRRHVLLS